MKSWEVFAWFSLGEIRVRRISWDVGANGQLIGYCLFNSSKYCNILAWACISFVNMNTNTRNKSLNKIKMQRWSDAAHLEINFLSNPNGNHVYTHSNCVFLFGVKWDLAHMSNKKYCYKSSPWRTRHMSILKLTLKWTQQADESFFFFLHIFGSVDITWLITALRRSKVQLT